MLWYHYDLEHAYGGGSSGSFFRQFLVLGDPEPILTPDRVRDACELAFDQLQDFVDEAIAMPWPGTREVPQVDTAIVGTRVHVWICHRAGLGLRVDRSPLDRPRPPVKWDAI